METVSLKEVQRLAQMPEIPDFLTLGLFARTLAIICCEKESSVIANIPHIVNTDVKYYSCCCCKITGT
jgi:hypothetical protein